MGGGTSSTWAIEASKKFTYLGVKDSYHYYRFRGNLTNDFKVFKTKNGATVEDDAYYNTISVNANNRSSFGWRANGNIYATTSGVYTLYFRTNWSTYEIYDIGTSSEKTVYFINGYNWTKPYIHAWNSAGDLTIWPGEAMEQVSGVTLAADVDNDEGGSTTTWYSTLTVWKATLSSTATSIKFSDNGGAQTGDLTATDGACYSYRVNGKFGDVAKMLVSTKAILETTEGSVTYHEQSYTKSICGVSDGDKAAILTTYGNLTTGEVDARVKQSAEESYVLTNDVSKGPGYTVDVQMKNIVGALNGFPNSLAAAIKPITSETNSTLVMTVAIMGATTALGLGFIALRKKRI